MQQFIAGTELRLEVTFRNLNGALVDPSSVEGEILLPDETTEPLSPERISTGLWGAAFTPVQNGLHIYRFSGAGDVVAAGEGSFMCQTQFPEE